ncbi:hypothetical protein HPP06_37820 [Corallococcus exiguus]|nr:hypothetical protein [Corallococcus exiguus]
MKGRKRHLLVDTEGLVHALYVHPANVQDRDGAQLLLGGKSPRKPSHACRSWGWTRATWADASAG